MFDIFIWSRILGRWDRLQSCSTLETATSIAGHYRRGYYATDPAWVQIKDAAGKVVYDSNNLLIRKVKKMLCICRNCGKRYEESKSRADYKGYCGQTCLHDQAWRLGYRKPKKKNRGVLEKVTEYQVLKNFNKIGSVPAEE